MILDRPVKKNMLVNFPVNEDTLLNFRTNKGGQKRGRSSLPVLGRNSAKWIREGLHTVSLTKRGYWCKLTNFRLLMQIEWCCYISDPPWPNKDMGPRPVLSSRKCHSKGSVEDICISLPTATIFIDMVVNYWLDVRHRTLVWDKLFYLISVSVNDLAWIILFNEVGYD